MGERARASRVDDRPGSERGGHAVVIGGGMAGLLAARVLADHFVQVTVVDRDRFPEGPGFRKGVPQGRHPHVLLGRGLEFLERLVPGFEAELVSVGAPVVDGSETLWLNAAGWSRRYRSPIRLLGASRELIEWQTRTRVAGLGNVRLLEGHEVVGLLAGPGRRPVTGVRLRSRGQGDRTAREADLEAAFVVDASGRGPGRRNGWPPSATGRPRRPASTPSSAMPLASTRSRAASRPTGGWW